MPGPKVIHQPRTQDALKRGITTLVSAIAPTLGPTPRPSIAQNQSKFELLDDGGLIARRIIALPQPDEDVGAMLLRQVLWQVHQHVGDGAATTAVLYERIYREGLRFMAAGADPMRLRARLMALLPRISAAPAGMTRALCEAKRSSRLWLFRSVMTKRWRSVLGEIIHCIGPYGQVDVRAGHGRRLEYNYVEGSYLERRPPIQGDAARLQQRGVAEMQDAAILVTDMDIEEPRDLVPVMSLALRCGIRSLLLVVASISETGLSVLLDKRLRDKIQTLVVKLDAYHPGELDASRRRISRCLTGARPLLQKAGERLEHGAPERLWRGALGLGG